MILIDALYINGGGGKVLLDYLILELEKTDKIIHYLVDERIIGKIQPVKSTNKLLYMKAGMLARRAFYRRHRDDFSSVLCFSNLPPVIKPNAKVYTYFHQQLFLEIPEHFSLKSKFLYNLKVMMLRHLSKNTDCWLVQSELVKERFVKKYLQNNVQILPFYPPLSINPHAKREEQTYLYVSNATSHKNHEALVEAFCNFYDQEKIGKLILTVSKEYSEIYELINDKIVQKYPIENIGFVERSQLTEIYSKAEFFVYPSLAESFGLGLVEAIENGCKVIGADLPYTYAVCEPSLTFDPLSTESIVSALSLSLQIGVKPSLNKVSNRINDLISLLQ